MNNQIFYRLIVQFLKRRNIFNPEYESSLIFCKVLNCARVELNHRLKVRISISQRIRIVYYALQRFFFKPMAHILGYRDFYQDRFIVSNQTLIPRADTESLIEQTLALKVDFQNILDIGTGTGCIALTLAKLFPNASIMAIDLHIETAKKNQILLNVNNVKLFRRDILKWSPPLDEYDLIISNPPYLSIEDYKILDKEVKNFEPKRALIGGKNGLQFYERIADISKQSLKKNGWLILEIDHKWQQVNEILKSHHYRNNAIFKDYNDLERVIIAQK